MVRNCGRFHPLVLAALLLAPLCAGCRAEPVTELPLGDKVVVQIRRDALGVAADLPIGPESSSINGAVTNVRGVLVGVTPEWLVLEVSGGSNVYVARSVVLLISKP